MALKNYTSQTSVDKSAAEILALLRTHRARAIASEYSDSGELEALSFTVSTPQGVRAYRLPARIDAVLAVMQSQYDAGQIRSKVDREQASRTGWRIIRDWVAAQMAIIDTEMVDIEEVMLPYMLTSGRKTVYDAFRDGGLAMLSSGIDGEP